jgi:Putative prokaryotic signal transducing protein
MIEILKTTDPVRLHFLKTMLEEAGLNPLLVEASAYPGVLASRLLVPDDEAPMARRVMDEAEKSAGA